MSDIIEFFFDFSSPYGYFATAKIEGLANKQGREAVWKPIMLGAAFKKTGNIPLAQQPIKGDYCIHDWERMGEFMEMPWVLPEAFPIPTLAAARAFYWLDDQDRPLAKRFAQAAYHRYFGEGVDITPVEAVAEIAAGLGVSRDELTSAVADPAIKDRLKRETAEAVERGVFGSPFFIVDGEGFWGSDRMWMIKKHLQRDSWTKSREEC
jgi:2-hydroxychromene-2-carboxylate isomerase